MISRDNGLAVKRLKTLIKNITCFKLLCGSFMFMKVISFKGYPIE